MRFFSNILSIFLLLPAFLALLGPHTVLSEEQVPFQLPSPSQLQRIKTAVLDTSRGRIVFELYPEKAPWHVANFKYLADKNFYDGIQFHIHQDGKIIQGGTPDPKDPDAGPGYSLPPEFNGLPHKRGTLGMARKPDLLNPYRSSHGSQFHILLTDASKMDGSFTVFGQIIEGLDIADSLGKGDTIHSLIVYLKP